MPCEVALKSVKKSFKNQTFPVLGQLLNSMRFRKIKVLLKSCEYPLRKKCGKSHEKNRGNLLE
jgi:hypothetical protein